MTMDYAPLPGGYGFGSSTLASWIKDNMAKDKKERGKGAYLSLALFRSAQSGTWLLLTAAAPLLAVVGMRSSLPTGLWGAADDADA